MTHALEKTKQRDTDVSGTSVCRMSFTLLKRRATTLGITGHDILCCARVEDLQALAKIRYRALMRRLHPDTRKQCYTRRAGKDRASQQFTVVVCAYKWIMGLPGWQSIDAWYWAPGIEPPLPQTMERHEHDLGYGWQYVGEM